MSRSDPVARVRGLNVARGLYGVVLLLAPDRTMARLNPGSSSARLFVRVLGVRQLAEAAILWWQPTALAVNWGIAVDAIHATSMIALAGRPRWRALALANAVSAGLWALLGREVDQRPPLAQQCGPRCAAASAPTGSAPKRGC